MDDIPALTSQRGIKKMPLSPSLYYDAVFINSQSILWQLMVTSDKMDAQG